MAPVDEWWNLDAHEVLERMAHAYATCQTYRDRGVVETVFPRTPTGPRVDRKPFTTVFARPLRLRYEFRDEAQSHARGDLHRIIWAEGATVGEWSSQRGVERTRKRDALAARYRMHPLSLALSAATGVSGGSAHLVPALLLRDIAHRSRVRRARRPEVEDVERVGQSECYVVVSGVWTLWIDAASWLIRRQHEVLPFGCTWWESTTHYRPEFDCSLGSDEFDPLPPRLA